MIIMKEKNEIINLIDDDDDDDDDDNNNNNNETIDLTNDDDIKISDNNYSNNISNDDELLLLAITHRNYINAHRRRLSNQIINLNKYVKALNDIIHWRDLKTNEELNFPVDSIQLLLELDIIIKNQKFQQQFINEDDYLHSNDDDDSDNSDDSNDSNDNNDDNNNNNNNNRTKKSRPKCSCCHLTGHNKLSCPINPKRKHNRILNGKKRKKKKKSTKKKSVIKHEWKISPIVQNECKIKYEK